MEPLRGHGEGKNCISKGFALECKVPHDSVEGLWENPKVLKYIYFFSYLLIPPQMFCDWMQGPYISFFFKNNLCVPLGAQYIFSKACYFLL